MMTRKKTNQAAAQAKTHGGAWRRRSGKMTTAAALACFMAMPGVSAVAQQDERAELVIVDLGDPVNDTERDTRESAGDTAEDSAEDSKPGPRFNASRLVPGDGQQSMPPDAVNEAEERSGVEFFWERPELGESRRELVMAVEVAVEKAEEQSAGAVSEVWGSVNGGPWIKLESDDNEDSRYWLSLDAGDFQGDKEIVLTVYAVDEDGRVAIADPYALQEEAKADSEDEPEADDSADSQKPEEAEQAERDEESAQDDGSDEVAEGDLPTGQRRHSGLSQFDGQPDFVRREGGGNGGVTSTGGGGSGGGGGGGGSALSGGGSSGGGGGGGGGGGAPPRNDSDNETDDGNTQAPTRPTLGGNGGGGNPDAGPDPEPEVVDPQPDPEPQPDPKPQTDPDPEPEVPQTPEAQSFDDDSSGVSGRVVGSVIVLSGVDVVTWESDRHVRLLYGAPIISGMAAAPSRNAPHTELTPYLGGAIFTAIPAPFRNAFSGYVVLGTSPGDVDLRIWSKSDNAEVPRREIMDWSAQVVSSHDPAVMSD